MNCLAAPKKENLYYNNFAIPAGHMVPLSAETGGRLDIVISHPVAQSEPRVADTPGFAAHVAAQKKENLYYNNFAIPAGALQHAKFWLSYNGPTVSFLFFFPPTVSFLSNSGEPGSTSYAPGQVASA